MCRILFIGLSISLLLTSVERARADDDPRAVLEKALKVMGGRDLVKQARAVKMKTKGVVHLPDDYKFSSELISQSPGQERHALQVDINGEALVLVLVLNGQKGWTSENGKVKDAEAAELADMQQSAYVNHVSTLVPLLDEKGYTFAKLGDSKVRDQDAVGIKITREGKPDVQLYFDRDTGLLIKTEHRHLDSATKKEVIEVQFLSDYREVDPASGAEAILKQAKVGVENSALLQYLRERMVKDTDRERIKSLIQKLGDSSFDTREKAKEDLVKRGVTAVPLLTQATKDPDAEISGRAKECLQQIGKSSDSQTLTAVLRLLAVRKPAGTVEALLAYLPSAPDHAVAQEVQATLAVVAFHEGKADAVLVKALEDKDLVRRAAAAAALGRGGATTSDPPGRRLTLSGLKYPAKVMLYHDGGKFMDWEVTEMQLFNKFDDAVFSKP